MFNKLKVVRLPKAINNIKEPFCCLETHDLCEEIETGLVFICWIIRVLIIKVNMMIIISGPRLGSCNADL